MLSIRKKQRLKLILMILLTSISTVHSEAQDWELERDKKGIRIYSKVVAGSEHILLRGEMRITAGLNQLVALFHDPKACSSWADMCQKAYVHSVISEYESYIYTYNDIPWPFTNRDAVSHIVWQQDPESLMVTMVGKAVEGMVAPEKGTIRITQADVKWEFIPAERGEINIKVKAHVDPAGQLPSWLSNMMMIKSLYKTLVKIRSMVNKGYYKNDVVEIIREVEE